MHSSKRMLAAPIAAAIAAAACARTAVTNAPGVIGHVYALDARDGHVVWRFDVAPGQRARARELAHGATLSGVWRREPDHRVRGQPVTPRHRASISGQRPPRDSARL
jgi:hypothetical protein